jgi:hypothetical protein
MEGLCVVDVGPRAGFRLFMTILTLSLSLCGLKARYGLFWQSDTGVVLRLCLGSLALTFSGCVRAWVRNINLLGLTGRVTTCLKNSSQAELVRRGY